MRTKNGFFNAKTILKTHETLFTYSLETNEIHYSIGGFFSYFKSNTAAKT